MKFTAIIPVFNGAEKITPTIRSMLDQSSVQDGRDSIELIVVDGASPDGTADVARAIGDDRITVISEPDAGMYDAVSKGLARADGDITCYLPAGEIYDPHAFSVVSDVMGEFGQINWLTGMSAVRDDGGRIIACRTPHPYERNLFDCGAYGDQLWSLQQESTFWRTPLNALIDIERFRTLKLAGDFFLWWSFAKKHELFVVSAFLSAFTFEEGQLSRLEPGAYVKELRTIARQPTWRENWQIRLRTRPQRRQIPRYSSKRMVAWSINKSNWEMVRAW